MDDLQTLLTPNAQPTTRASRLRVEATVVSGFTPTLILRTVQLTPDGKLVQSTDQMFPTFAGNPTVKIASLTDNRLISISITTSANALYPGICYVRAGVVSGNVNDPTQFEPLMSGYVTSGAALSFPLTPPVAPTEGVGNKTFISTADPVAGAELIITLPSSALYQLRSLQFRFAAAAVVAARTIALLIEYDGVCIYRLTARTTITISQARNYTLWLGPNMPADNATDHYLPCPDLLFAKTLVFETETANIDAADQYSLLTTIFTEWALP